MRIINFRSFLISAALCALTVGIGVLQLFIPVLSYILFSLVCVGIVVLGVFFRKTPFKWITFAFSFVCVVALFVNFTVTLNNYKNELPQSSYTISGRVYRTVEGESNGKIYLNNLFVDGKSIGGNFIITVDEDAESVKYLRTGDIVEYRSTAIFNELVENGKLNTYGLVDDLRYFGYADFNELKVSYGTQTQREKFLFELSKTLDNWMGDYGSVAFGMITGNKDAIPTSIREGYSVSGIAHILAVSGLHVGFLVAVFEFLLKRIRKHKWIKLVVIGVILLSYNILIGFPLSAVRATVMSMVALCASYYNERNDTLNNLCLSITVVLVLFPLSAMDAGFLMSISAVGGIVCFFRPLHALFSRIMPRKISSAISVSLASQIGIFPVMTYYFNTFSTYSLLVNIVAVPVLSIVYVLVFVFSLLAMLVPFFGWVLAFIKYAFVGIDYLNAFISSLPFASITVYGGAALFLMWIAYFVASRFVMLPKKYIAIVVSVILCVGLVVVENIPTIANRELIFSSWEYTSLVRYEGKTTLIGEIRDTDKIVKMLESSKVRRLSEAYLLELDEKSVNALVVCKEKYHLDKVYIHRYAYDDEVAEKFRQKGINIAIFETDFAIEAVYDDGYFVGYGLKDSGLLVVRRGVEVAKLSNEIFVTYTKFRAYRFEPFFADFFAICNYGDGSTINFGNSVVGGGRTVKAGF